RLHRVVARVPAPGAPYDACPAPTDAAVRPVARPPRTPAPGYRLRGLRAPPHRVARAGAPAAAPLGRAPARPPRHLGSRARTARGRARCGHARRTLSESALADARGPATRGRVALRPRAATHAARGAAAGGMTRRACRMANGPPRGRAVGVSAAA